MNTQKINNFFKIILIGNYFPDKQESMERFTQMLANEITKAANIEIEIWRPVVFCSKFSNSTLKGIGKWLGYLDKWIIFPMILYIKLFIKKRDKNTHFHICDHSNSPYLSYLPKNCTSITCHDVLAIRGALGYSDAYCPSSKTGIILQKWILRNLNKARKLAAVSNATFRQLTELVPVNNNKEKKWTIIYNAFNAEFKLMPANTYQSILENVGINVTRPYILHTGSDHLRKNRSMLVKMVKTLGDKWNGNICFVGMSIEEKLMHEIEEAGLTYRVSCVVRPDHRTLTALYSGAYAFIFPSYSEGFGWPVIEAQACGIPVIASNIEPLPEISGGAAIHCNPNDPSAFGTALLKLQDETTRQTIIDKGLENIKRFENSSFIANYLTLIIGESK